MKHCIQLDEGKISSMPIGRFFRFTLRKVILDLILAIILVFIFIYSVPWAKNAFIQLSLYSKIIDVLVNVIIYGVILYPAACFLIVYFQRRRCREKK